MVDLVDQASSGVEGLAGAATAALAKAGPVGAVAQPVVNVLRDVWEGYFGVPIPPGSTNWNAYTHQQLHDMLWQGADVGEVSSVAADWGRHSSELADNADTLRAQQSTLQQNWTGAAAQPAASRLGQLGEQSSGISSRASTVQRSAQSAGDALAHARNAMPPPPGDQTGLVLSGAAAGAGVGALIGGALGAGAGGIGAGPGALMGAAIGAVAGGGASLLAANVAAAEQKAQAVHVMQTYESSLGQSSAAVAGAGASGGPSQSTGLSDYAGPMTGGGGLGGGMAWNRLVGTSPYSTGLSAGRADVSGVGLLNTGAAGRSGAVAEEAAAEPEGMAPGLGRSGRRAEDQEHNSALPIVDQKLFDLDVQATPPVIGA